MARRVKAKAQPTSKRERKPGKVEIEIPGRPLTPEERKQLKAAMKLVELGVQAMAQGVAFTRQSLTKRRR